ncbi:MAG: hypothetical protein LBC38_04300 [Oscillospiraceae bacterium]|jgi:hypothetical protein|nr:hypothetical protein [Oscillospiraceae bacterium]
MKKSGKRSRVRFIVGVLYGIFSVLLAIFMIEKIAGNAFGRMELLLWACWGVSFVALVIVAVTQKRKSLKSNSDSGKNPEKNTRDEGD